MGKNPRLGMRNPRLSEAIRALISGTWTRMLPMACPPTCKNTQGRAPEVDRLVVAGDHGAVHGRGPLDGGTAGAVSLRFEKLRHEAILGHEGRRGLGVGKELPCAGPDHDAGFRVSLPQGIEPVNVIRVRVGDDEIVGADPELLQLTDDPVGHGRYPRIDQGRSRLSPDEVEGEKRIAQGPEPLIQACREGTSRRLRRTSHGPEINPLRNL